MPQPEPTGETGLPKLAEIFHALRRGRHICSADGDLFTCLTNHYTAYQILLKDLGFTLQRHPRDFFYLEDNVNFTDISGKMALFVFVLVESLADRGLVIEETLMSRSFMMSELPHLQGERYRELMREADVATPEQLANVVAYLERYGFIRKKPDDQFEFLPPTYRYLDICMDYANRSATNKRDNSDDSNKEEGGHDA